MSAEADSPDPTTKLIDGRASARKLLDRARQQATRILSETGSSPKLATLLVGDDPASATYVRMKSKRCGEIGVTSIKVALPRDTSTAQLVGEIERLGTDPGVHAILLQHPVPSPIDRRAAFDAIPLDKDVDGVNSGTLGRVVLGIDSFVPCTPLGIMTLLKDYAVSLDGAHAVVLGRSPILGRPMSALLINAHATVTLCHSRTREVASIVRAADVLIAAIGQPKFVQGDWIKPGAVVIDAGYNIGTIGDVDFEACFEQASLITPVPGGVGPMTIATLLAQTVQGAAKQLGVSL